MSLFFAATESGEHFIATDIDHLIIKTLLIQTLNCLNYTRFTILILYKSKQYQYIL